MSGPRWFRDIYRDAVWEDETLTAIEKAVAETYVRHARDQDDRKSATADLSWLTYERLMTKAGIGRRANVAAAVAGLVKAGWLVVHREVNRRPTVYRLVVPLLGSSDAGTSAGSSDGGTSVVPVSDAGSSAQSDSPDSGSSDGGTPPLKDLPKEKTPSSSSRPAGLDELQARIPVDDDEGVWILEKIRSNANGPIRKSMRAYLAKVDDADLTTYREDYATKPEIEPEWCGKCESPQVRHVQVEGSYGQGIVMARCPRCNVLSAKYQRSEPEPVKTGYQPYRNPTDPEAYYKGWNAERSDADYHAPL
jgi:hypothetical protein